MVEDTKRRLTLTCAGFAYLIFAILLEPPYPYGGDYRVHLEAAMIACAIACFAVATFPLVGWLRSSSLVVVTVVTVARGLILIFDIGLYLPGAQWLFIAFLQVSLWPHLLPLPGGHGRPNGA